MEGRDSLGRFIKGFPKKKKRQQEFIECKCGCGQLRSKYSKNGIRRYYIHNHHLIGKSAPWHKTSKKQKIIECACGCGETFLKYSPKWKERRYIRGHSLKGRKKDNTKINLRQKGKHWSPKTEFKKGSIPWNKGLKNCWNNEILKKLLTRRTPNNEEKFLIDFFVENNLPYRFVGNGEFILGGRNPDFINVDGEKQIIEFFGEHWHKLEDENIKRNIYQKYGFKLLVIWGKELRNKENLLKKILIFERG